MAQFVKVYDWSNDLGYPIEKRFIFSLIHQFTESKDGGYWGGYAVMAQRLGIPKSICKRIVNELKEEGIVSEDRKTFLRKTRIFLFTNKEAVKDKLSRAHA